MNQIYENNKILNKKITDTLDWGGIINNNNNNNDAGIDDNDVSTHFNTQMKSQTVTNNNNRPMWASQQSNYSNYNKNMTQDDEETKLNKTYNIISARDITKRDYLSLKYNRNENEDKSNSNKSNRNVYSQSVKRKKSRSKSKNQTEGQIR